jgi:hypothetical protein
MGTGERSHFYRWLVFLTNTLQARIMTALYSERLADDNAGAEAVKRHAQEQVSATLDIIEDHLASAGPGCWALPLGCRSLPLHAQQEISGFAPSTCPGMTHDLRMGALRGGRPVTRDDFDARSSHSKQLPLP